jgi:hypothetical protein
MKSPWKNTAWIERYCVNHDRLEGKSSDCFAPVPYAPPPRTCRLCGMEHDRDCRLINQIATERDAVHAPAVCT